MRDLTKAFPPQILPAFQPGVLAYTYKGIGCSTPDLARHFGSLLTRLAALAALLPGGRGGHFAIEVRRRWAPDSK